MYSYEKNAIICIYSNIKARPFTFSNTYDTIRQRNVNLNLKELLRTCHTKNMSDPLTTMLMF